MKRLLIIIASTALLLVAGLYIRQIIHETVDTHGLGQRSLVSFGDSVASGAGLSEDGRQGGCDVTDKAYAVELGKLLDEPVEQFACSGAKVSGRGAGDAADLATQLKTARPFLKGSDVVITAGANDIGWVPFLVSCTTGNCATEENRQAFVERIKALQADYAAFLADLRRAKPKHVVINTYYELAHAGDTCVSAFGLTEDEIAFINEQEALLNAAITEAATDNKATITAIDFSGHLYCDKDTWLQRLRDPVPLHPTAAGQAYMARQDAAALKK